MLKKGEKPTNKRVYWDESVQDNEGRTKRRKIEHPSQKNSNLSQEEVKKIIDSLKRHLFRSSSPQLEDMLSRYSPDAKLSILSTGDLFGAAAAASNIKALRFIISIVPQSVAYTMLHNRNAFESFLCHEYALEELAKSDHQKRVEGFKIFFKIDSEFAQKIFDSFNSKWCHTTYQRSLRNDLNSAIAQL
jgi:hypothetical protein